MCYRLLLIVCAVALLATPVVAGVQATVVEVAPCPQVAVIQAAPVVVQTVEVQTVAVQTVCATATTYALGSRRLNLRERIKSNVSNRKANRVAKVATLEPVVAPPAVVIRSTPCCLGQGE